MKGIDFIIKFKNPAMSGIHNVDFLFNEITEQGILSGEKTLMETSSARAAAGRPFTGEARSA